MESANSELINILLKKWDKKSLSHFYLFRSRPGPQARTILNEATQSFLAQIIVKEKKISLSSATNTILNGHPDILYINEPERAKNYTLNDEAITDFLKFHSYGNFELQQRFAIINDAAFLSETILNKFLKTLEEPTKNTTIIFLEPTGTRLMPTIESRAITFNFTFASESIEHLQKDLLTYLQATDDFAQLQATDLESYSKMHELLKGNKALERSFYEHAFSWAISNASHYKELQEIQKTMEWTQRSLTFHNSESQRLSAILNILHKIAV